MGTQSIDHMPQVTAPKADIQPKGSNDSKPLNATTAMIALIVMEMAYMGHLKKALPELKKNYEAMSMFQMMENWSGNYTRGQLVAALANKSGGAITVDYLPFPIGAKPTITTGVPVDPTMIGSYMSPLNIGESSKIQSPHVIVNQSDGQTYTIFIMLPTSMNGTPFQQWAVDLMKTTVGQSDYHQAGIYTGADDAIATRAADGMQSKFDVAKMILSNIHELFAGLAQLTGGKANAAASS